MALLRRYKEAAKKPAKLGTAAAQAAKSGWKANARRQRMISIRAFTPTSGG